MTLHDDAAEGTLDEKALKAYLNTSNSIDAPSTQDDDTEGYTALALAALEGHAHVVELLLRLGAKADALSSEHRTPLWIATDRPRGKERAKIVGMLLDKGANAKYSHSDLGVDSTPLVNELRQLRDPEVIKLLVKHNGVTDAAKDLAEKLGMTQLLLNPSEIIALRAAIVANIVAFVDFVMGWANRIGRWINSIFEKFGLKGLLRGKKAEDIGKEISKTKTKEEFKKSAKEFIQKHKLEHFFPEKKGNFLETLVNKAMEIQKDPTSPLSKAGKTDQLVILALYQPVIYCDDSGSMSCLASTGETRMQVQAQLVERISSICTRLVPEHLGVHLRFINRELRTGADNLQMDDIRNLVAQVQPSGGTEIGGNLRRQILDPFMYNVAKMERPLFVSIITDGIPTDKDRLKREIIDCRKYLKRNGLPERSVVFQLSQVGSDTSSEEFLRTLRDDSNLKRILYVTAQKLDSEYNDLRRNEDQLESWLLKTLLGPITDSSEV